MTALKISFSEPPPNNSRSIFIKVATFSREYSRKLGEAVISGKLTMAGDCTSAWTPLCRCKMQEERWLVRRSHPSCTPTLQPVMATALLTHNTRYHPCHQKCPQHSSCQPWVYAAFRSRYSKRVACSMEWEASVRRISRMSGGAALQSCNNWK